jgi:hypothetical protein
MITSLTSMTSTCGLKKSKIKNSMYFTYRVIFLTSGTSVASMTSTASTNSVASMISTSSIHQKLTELNVFINPDTKMTYSGLLMWDGSS